MLLQAAVPVQMETARPEVDRDKVGANESYFCQKKVKKDNEDLFFLTPYIAASGFEPTTHQLVKLHQTRTY